MNNCYRKYPRQATCLHYESYSRTGTGYEACVHIYDYPEVLDDYWLTNPCNQENTIVTISIHNEDQNE